MSRSEDRLTDQAFVAVCGRASSMAEAATALGLHFNTFRRRALKLGCYRPNPSGKGKTKEHESVPLAEILVGKHPHYQTFKLKCRLVRGELKQNKCEVCGIEQWLGLPLNMELDHLNGDRTDHRWNNLRMICPNCHAQTQTYRSRNRLSARRETAGAEPVKLGEAFTGNTEPSLRQLKKV